MIALTCQNISVRRQCALLDVPRSSLLYKRQPRSDDTEMGNRIAEIYQRYPVYGYRRLTQILRHQGTLINAKRVLRLMRDMGLQAIYSKPRTTKRDLAHRVYPYLLGHLKVTRPHQVWQTDITYIRVEGGFMHMNALIDLYSRVLVGWTLSNSLDTQSCLSTLENAIEAYGVPDIINSDQGCQYTSSDWTGALDHSGIKISINGRGRSNDNAYIERFWRTLKYEGFILWPFETVVELKKALNHIIHWYNDARPHKAHAGKTPASVLNRNWRKQTGLIYTHPRDGIPDQMVKGYGQTVLI